MEILDENFNLNNKAAFDFDTVKEINQLKIEVNENVPKIIHGRAALLALCLLTMIGMFFTTLSTTNQALQTDTMVGGIVVLVIYAGLATAVRYNPKVALIAGLTIYLLMIILNMVIDPATLIRGFLIKGFIIYYLARGISSALKVDKNSKRLHKIGIPLRELNTIKRLEHVSMTPYPKKEME